MYKKIVEIKKENKLQEVVNRFVKLGKMLGFTQHNVPFCSNNAPNVKISLNFWPLARLIGRL